MGAAFDQRPQMLPAPGQLILPGPVDPNTQQPTVITASPLYGVRQWNFAEQNDQDFLNNLSQPASQRSRLDERTLQRLREELNRNLQTDPTNEGQDGQTGGGQRNNDPNNLNNQIDSRLTLSLNDTTSPQLQNRVDASVNSGINQNIRPGDLSINTPGRQSPQYQEMQRRLNRFKAVPEQVAMIREYQEQQRARAGTEAEGQRQGTARTGTTGRPGEPTTPDTGTGTGATTARPGTALPGPGAGTLGTAGTGTMGTTTQQPTRPDTGLPDYAQRSKDIMAGKDSTDPTAQLPGAEKSPPDQAQTTVTPGSEAPLRVNSLATGVNAKALADFLNEAEKLMREGKFYSALDQYEMADQVAPNDPMVNLGRAIAELGASYYARAEGHLREAFTKNPALLMAQYDLKGFLGQERLEFLVNDLRSISNKETNEPRSVFLLAFIDYNTGNARRASAYLDLAERRAGKPDPLYQNMRKLWNLPAAQGGGEGVNK
jgi:tetratricopeptide (TPR) repeat protein